jgi:hypothetical protein
MTPPDTKRGRLDTLDRLDLAVRQAQKFHPSADSTDYGYLLALEVGPLVPLLREWIAADAEARTAEPNADGFVDTTRLIAAEHLLLAALGGES